ncbi:hypothetical protein [Hymenobacter arizonensis]|uniref:Uncharacterized protein n=1 Tax=Hymenobacter arizonensis TaxID=1227077 RepID=A0A1I6B674_HYMAR|nr:hypothetical protein [Hymenobacter arizonensis]SFQ76409.1 hypothetical protein SAMN04515668_4208 [Hymenobacter arizonensis]
MKALYKIIPSAFLAGALFFVSCDKQREAVAPSTSALSQDGKAAQTLSAPILSFVSVTGSSITLSVCGGSELGAPAGFSVQWMLKSEFDATGWPASSDVVESSSFCKASFSGVPGASGYNIKGMACAYVTIGDVMFDQVGASSPCEDVALKCSKEYVFRAFAHNVPQGAAKSNWSIDAVGITANCSEVGTCTYTQGFWKTHGPVPKGNNAYVWPASVKADGLSLGGTPYDALRLLTLFNTKPAGNGFISLAHQLIAAKLNVANGADASSVAANIAAADALIAKAVNGYLAPGATSELTTLLDNYNSGKPGAGPGHCPDKSFADNGSN